MQTFVLVHGACHGGWCWYKLAVILREKNYQVYTPTLTGMGERVHLLNETISLQTHIDDIINVIRYEDLTDVVLVGHSYAGLVIGSVNEALPDRISNLVFLDAYIPQNGKTGFDIVDERYSQSWQHVAQIIGNGWKNPAGPASLEIWGIDDPELQKFLLGKITDFSINFMKTPTFLTSKFDKVDKSFIRCTYPSYCFDLISPHYQSARQQGWPTYEIATGHDPMLTKPAELAEILLQIIS